MADPHSLNQVLNKNFVRKLMISCKGLLLRCRPRSVEKVVELPPFVKSLLC